MATERVEILRKQIVNAPFSYRKLSQETGIGPSYIRQFAVGIIDEPTVSRFDALVAGMSRLNGADAA